MTGFFTVPKNDTHVGHGQDIPTDVIITTGVVSAILLFVIIMATQTWFYNYHTAELERKVVSQPYIELQTIRADQIEKLNSYRMVDSERDVVMIPIDLAIERYVRHRGDRSPGEPD